MARGEIVIVVGDRRAGVVAPDGGRPPIGEDALVLARAEVERLVAEGAARGEAARRVAVDQRDPAASPLRGGIGRVGSVHAVGDRPPADPRRAVPGLANPGARDDRASPSRPSCSTGGSGADPTLVFVVAAVAILGLAWVVGLSTERLGALTGPQVGGILNATFGNIAELIIAFFALQAGLIEVVKASLTGSIIGNLLLVLGASVLFGGLRNGIQRFDPRVAGSNAALLVVAAIGLFVPAVFALSAGPGEPGTITEESVLVAGSCIVGYVLSLVFAVHQLEPDAGRPRAPGRARRAGLEPLGGGRRAPRGRRPPGDPLRDPRRLHRALHRDVRAVGVLRRA